MRYESCFCRLSYSDIIGNEVTVMTVKPNKMMLTRILAVMLVLIIALSVVSTGSLVNIMIIKGEKYQDRKSVV